MPEDYGYEISHYFVALGPDKMSLIATKVLYLKTITFAVVRYKMVNIDQTVKGISDDMVQYLERRCPSSLECPYPRKLIHSRLFNRLI